MTTGPEPLPGVTAFGAKLHREIAGPPEQDKLTALENSPTGSTLKLYVAD
jgi:hypothetical protein